MVLQTRQKSIAGVAQKAKQGAFLGDIAPLGYNIVNGQYVINSREAAAIRLIFDSYAFRESYTVLLISLHRGATEAREDKCLARAHYCYTQK